MENPSLRVSGHGGSLNRTFIAEDCSADDFGQWAMDEVSGEQDYVDDEKSCSWTWDDNEYAWQSRRFKSRQLKRRKGKGKGRDKGRSKRTGRVFFGEKQAQYSELWSQEDFAWWTKGRQGKKGWSKSNDGSQKGS